MKRIAAVFLSLILFCAVLPAAYAVNTDRSYRFALTANGSSSAAAVAVGDKVTVSVTLTRTDSTEGYPMYSMQDDVLYNTNYFELVEDSISFETNVPAGNIRYSQRAMDSHSAWAGWNKIVMSTYSTVAGGIDWPNTKVIGTFQLKAIRSGSTALCSQTYEMAISTGMDKYESTANDVDVAITGQTTPSTGGTGTGGGGSGNTGASPETGTAINVAETYSDVSQTSWYYDAVSYVVNHGLFRGVSENVFSPNATMTRGMFVTVLARLNGAAVDDTASGGFGDVAPGTWYAGSVAWAAENGIVSGKSNGVFDPNGEITREQMALILYNYAKYAGLDVSAVNDTAFEQFADKTAADSWAKDALIWAADKGIVSGTGTGLEPLGSATRAQVAQIILNYCTLITGVNNHE